jgi:apolipoprotein D and lipocalin family protein
MKIILLTAVFATISLLLISCRQHRPLPVVDKVDLDKYAGKWYSIASLPTSFEKGCACTSAEYGLSEKGHVTVKNSCFREGKNSVTSGKAFVKKNSNNAKLSVQFFWPFKGDYWIIALGDQYQYAMVGHPNRKYLWILNRERTMPEETLKGLLEKAASLGFDTDKVRRINQSNCTQ